MVGKSRKTLYSHIKKGVLSANRDSEGNKVIDKDELLRVYGKLVETDKVNENSGFNRSGLGLDGSGVADELERLKRNNAIMLLNIQSLRKENALLKELLSDARMREKDVSDKHEKMLSIFERMLPSAKK